jgi:hypothetical protein
MSIAGDSSPFERSLEKIRTRVSVRGKMRIIVASVKQGGKVWIGYRRGLIIPEVFGKIGKRVTSAEQGFILEDGTYVDRKQAAQIALESGQVQKLGYNDSILSEELW